MSNDDKTLPELVDGIRFAMLTAAGLDGLDSRPLTVQRVDDRAIWFLIGRDADWNDDLDDTVNVAFVGDDTWVSVTGSATTTTDRATLEDLGNPVADTYFNEGTEPMALKVSVDHAGWWTSPGTVRTAIDFARAKLTGTQPDAGDHGEIG